MKGLITLLVCLALALNTAKPQTDGSVVVGKTDSIYSKILKEKRAIWVSVPNADSSSLYSHHVAYPVAYLLDGPDHFIFVRGLIQQLSGNAICPNMILVGIPNTDRTRDLTPTHTSGGPINDSASVATSGGGEGFTSFIEKELIPHIDSLYKTKPYRMLIGHSLGGLLAVNTLVKHPALFNSYVAIDPSMWWDNEKLLKEVAAALRQKTFDTKALFLGVANTMKPGMDTLEVRKDTAASTRHIRAIFKLRDLLKDDRNSGLRWSWKYYNEEDHGTVPLLAEYDALHFIFRDYRLPAVENTFDSTFDAAGAISKHFDKVSKQMGYTVLPPEPLVNQLGYAFLQNKRFEKAKTFFEMNIKNYPESFNVYDSMGDCYSAIGDKQKAINFYTKALSLREYPDTRQKMEKLQSMK